MIAVTTDNRLFSVSPSSVPTLWVGQPVRRGKIRGTYEVKPGTEPELVSKTEVRVVSQFRLR